MNPTPDTAPDEPAGYRWSYADGAGAELPGPPETFTEQVLAEDWLSENWPDLLGGGIEQVSLLHGTELVYGPMSLHPPD